MGDGGQTIDKETNKQMGTALGSVKSYREDWNSVMREGLIL